MSKDDRRHMSLPEDVGAPLVGGRLRRPAHGTPATQGGTGSSAAVAPSGSAAALRPKPRLKKLRLLAILLAGLVLGVISFAFGMFMAVSSDLPQLENYAQFNDAGNSQLLDDQGRALSRLTQQNRILLKPGQIPALVKDAVISVEDKRFFHNSGIDVRGIGRAVVADVLHKGTVQGASTIEQQFVKNVLQAQAHRTIFEKLREAALAFHLTRKWSKDKIITEYLNTIYFGNGAYGIEAAAQTYFGRDVNHRGCGLLRRPLCVTNLAPWEAALLGALIASPTAYDPARHPVAALERRNLVLRDMLAQGYLNRSEYAQSVVQAPPAAKDIAAPQQTSVAGADTGYFDDWVQQQVIDRYGPQLTFLGGLKIRTSLDLDMQKAAESTVSSYLSDPGGPTASLVAIDNRSGQVRAMVGGRNFDQSPFNLATEGERQPGSSFKVFDLAAALESGISPDSVWPSRLKVFHVPHASDRFVVHNDEGAYTGTNTLSGAIADSDNSIFAQVGLQVGTSRIARLAARMGIRTPISTNPAMTIGGLTTGVTVLDMAHAYETLAEGGRRVGGSLVAGGGPIGIRDVQFPNRRVDRDVPVYSAVLPAGVAATETTMLEGVISNGTGTAAALGQFAAGKTGTTSNYGDAWFVGWNSRYTVAVWVGYPQRLTPMTTQFAGKPVLGGTFPALIWHDFMLKAMALDRQRGDHAAAGAGPPVGGAATGASASSSSTSSSASVGAGVTSSATVTSATQSVSRTGSPTASGASTTAPVGGPPPSTPTRPATTPTPAAAPAPRAAPAPVPGRAGASGGTGAPAG